MVNVKLHTLSSLQLATAQGSVWFFYLCRDSCCFPCSDVVQASQLETWAESAIQGIQGSSSLVLSFPRFTPPHLFSKLNCSGLQALVSPARKTAGFLLHFTHLMLHCGWPMWGTFSKKWEIIQCQLLCTHFESSPKSLCLGSAFTARR